jgi:Ca-activated chloride channel family protein
MKRLSFVAAGFLCVTAGAQQIQPQPISVGIVFDTSRTMGGKLKYSRQVLDQFLKGARPGDEFSLALIDDRPHLASGLSTETKDVRDRLAFAQSRGSSALYDTIYLAAHEMKAAANSRRLLLVISDGANNNSHYTRSEIENGVRDAGVEIYTIGIYESLGVRARSPEENAGPEVLSDLSERTGGKHYAVDTSLGTLPDVGAEVSNAMHASQIKQ